MAEITRQVRAREVAKYVIPTMLGTVSFFLFTIVDGIFVGRGVGTNALGAVNLMMPFIMVVNALFQLATIGGVTIVAIRLGRGDTDGANKAFMHALSFAVLIALVLSAIGVFLTGPICRLLGANDTYLALAKEYLFWYALFIIPSGLSTALQGFCRNDGSPVLVSVAVMTGACLNIFGDWLLVFPLQMGLAGAALATGVSQIVTLLIVCTHFMRKKGVLRITRFTFDPALLKKIAMRGLPECIAQFATPVSILCTNLVLLKYVGDVGVNAFSIISYVASFSVAVFIGTAEGLQPLIGRSYGAHDSASLKYCFRAGLVTNIAGSLVINLILMFLSGAICRLFGADEATLDCTLAAMPIYASGFVVMAVNTMISSYLYSTKRTREAVIMNIIRSFIATTLVILLLPSLFGESIIWYTFAIYEALVLVIAVILLKRSERNGIVYR